MVYILFYVGYTFLELIKKNDEDDMRQESRSLLIFITVKFYGVRRLICKIYICSI